MLNTIKLSEIKNLLISARNNIHSQLKLNKTKDIKYNKNKYFDLLGTLSLFNCCAEDGSQTMNLTDDIPSGDALLQQLKKLHFGNVEDQFHELFAKQFYKVFPGAKKGRKYKAIVFIDVHEQETYSKKKRTSKNINGGKHKNGTNFFFKYMTLQVMIKRKLITLGVRFLTKDDKQPELVDGLIRLAKEFVKIEVALLDRGFRDVTIFNNLEYLNVPILMPCVKDKKAEKCFEELGKKNFKAVKFWMKNLKHEFADVKLLMIRLSSGKEFGFYTTLKFTWLHGAKYYINIYKKRWNIETGYRLQNMFLPKTTSINKVIRFFYFCYAIAMHNLWLIIRQTTNFGKMFTVLKMKFVFVLFWITTHLPSDWL